MLGYCEVTAIKFFLLHFTTRGRPIKLSCSAGEGVNVKLVLATLEPKQSLKTSSQQSQQSQQAGNNSSNSNREQNYNNDNYSNNNRNTTNANNEGDPHEES